MKNIYRFTALVIICVLFLSCGRSSYNVGDTVMSDGTVLTPSQLQVYKGSAEPVAVIFSVTGGEHENSKRVLGVGLKASSTIQRNWSFPKIVSAISLNETLSAGFSISSRFSFAPKRVNNTKSGDNKPTTSAIIE